MSKETGSPITLERIAELRKWWELVPLHPAEYQYLLGLAERALRIPSPEEQPRPTRPEALKDIPRLRELCRKGLQEPYHISGSPDAFDLASAARTAFPAALEYIQALEASTSTVALVPRPTCPVTPEELRSWSQQIRASWNYYDAPVIGEELEKLADWLQRSARPTWQPIESAPKDGTEILLAWDGKTRIAHWLVLKPHYNTNKPGIWKVPSLQTVPYKCEPTHWQPIPEPPGISVLAEPAKERV